MGAGANTIPAVSDSKEAAHRPHKVAPAALVACLRSPQHHPQSQKRPSHSLKPLRISASTQQATPELWKPAPTCSCTGSKCTVLIFLACTASPGPRLPPAGGARTSTTRSMPSLSPSRAVLQVGRRWCNPSRLRNDGEVALSCWPTQHVCATQCTFMQGIAREQSRGWRHRQPGQTATTLLLPQGTDVSLPCCHCSKAGCCCAHRPSPVTAWEAFGDRGMM